MAAPRPLESARTLCREQGLIPPGSTVLCALSGGADSVCLLHWLSQLRLEHPFTLLAAHYDHNLRGAESRRDEQFVRELTARMGIELFCGQGDVAAQAARNKTGLEETARDMRYAFLRQTARQTGAELIATAHNADDNAETLLLHLLRGCGLRGLCGMAPSADGLIRPLLTTPRTEIEAYLTLYDLPHVEDSTNADQRFTRNRLRARLLPLLRELDPHFLEHAGNTMAALRLDEDFLCAQAQSVCDRAVPIPGGLELDAGLLAGLPDPICLRCARLLMARMNGGDLDCTAAHLRAVAALCRGTDPSAQVSLPGGLVARRRYHMLELIRLPEPAVPQARPLPLPGTAEYPGWYMEARRTLCPASPPSPYSFYLSCAKVPGELTLRPRRTGDRIALPGRHSRTLKKLMIDQSVPRPARDHIPVLDCGGQVAAVVGFGPDTAFLPRPGEECWHIQCIPIDKEKGSQSK